MLTVNTCFVNVNWCHLYTVEHLFELVIENVSGLKLVDNMIWGEADCYVQYHFPAQMTNAGRAGSANVVCGMLLLLLLTMVPLKLLLLLWLLPPPVFLAFSRSYWCTQYDRLLAWYCHLSVHLTKCIVALSVGVGCWWLKVLPSSS